MHPIQGLSWHHYVIQGAPWVGEVSLLQDQHGVPEGPVPEVHPHHRPRQRLAPTLFDWVEPRSHPCNKLQPVGSRLVDPVCLVSILSQPSFSHAVLGLVVHHQ